MDAAAMAAYIQFVIAANTSLPWKRKPWHFYPRAFSWTLNTLHWRARACKEPAQPELPVKTNELLERASMHVFSGECITWTWNWVKREWLCDINDALEILPCQTPKYGVAYSSSYVPYCYYYLWVLYFANFCDSEIIAKLSTCKNFYQHIRHPGVCTFTKCTLTNCVMFSTLEHA